MDAETVRSAFASLTVIGDLDPAALAARLGAMGDPAAEEIEQAVAKGPIRLFSWDAPRAWQHTTHQFGHLGLRQPGSLAPQPIRHAGTLKPDPSLRNSRIDVRLSRLHIHEYPGGGAHRVLVTFAAQNQVQSGVEPIGFSQTYRVEQGQLAGVQGQPIFIGLSVGTLGAGFECATVNVQNDDDEALLAALDAPPIRKGLGLLTTAQPALAPFTEITLGIVRMLAERHRNVAVQKFYLGLDFTTTALGIRLAEGDYIAAQVPGENALNWDEWTYSPSSGAIVHREDAASSLPYNYLIFGITRHQE